VLAAVLAIGRLRRATLCDALLEGVASDHTALLLRRARLSHAVLEDLVGHSLALVQAGRRRWNVAVVPHACLERRSRLDRAVFFHRILRLHARLENALGEAMAFFFAGRRRRRRTVGGDARLKRRTGHRSTVLLGVRRIYNFLHARSEGLAGSRMTLFHAVRNIVALIRETALEELVRSGGAFLLAR
jgi:hypothetical protein